MRPTLLLDHLIELRIKLDAQDKRIAELEQRVSALESKPVKKKGLTTASPGAALGRFFKDCWEKRYAASYPAWGAKQNTLMKKFASEVPANQQQDLIRLYLAYNGPKIVAAGHPVEWMLSSLPRLVSDLNAHRAKRRAIKGYISEQNAGDWDERYREIFGPDERTQDGDSQGERELPGPDTKRISEEGF